jgi:soluble lytic murein transglycosylase-like protein
VIKFQLALLCAAGAYAQTPANFEDIVRAAMAPSLAQQRASVRTQAAAAAKTAAGSPAATSFFTGTPPTGLGLLAECDPLPDEQLNGIITGAAQRQVVGFEVIKAVIEEESAARPCAISFRGAEGLMQLMPATAEELKVQDPFDPKQNVEAGAQLLKLLLGKYDNNLALALSAYNAGSGRVDQEGGIPPIPETLNYVADILRKLRPTEDKPTGTAPSVAAPEHQDR